MNASMEFDPDTLSPTYRVRVGLPGQSNALAIAARLGMPQDVLERARQALSPDQVAMAGLLSDIQQERDEAVAARRAEEFARREAEEIRSGLSERLASLEAERDAILAQARQELEDELAETKERLRAAQRRLDRADRAALAEANADIAAASQKVASLRRRRPRRRSDEKPREVALGDNVWLRGISNPGTVIAAPADGEVEVQLGLARTRVPLDRIERFQTPGSTTVIASARGTARGEPVEPRAYVPALELDLRGLRADEAIARLDTYLDDAFRSGAPSVRVIHGLGTGVLRQQVRQLLSKHPLVKAYAPAERSAGGEGATVVELAV
jgi:DNA mismatch repair protein MutS2